METEIVKKQKKALDFFNQGYNCAQSVILTFTKELKTDRETLIKLSSGLGGGMGQLQKTCGAVSGGIIVISILTANATSDKNERNILVRERIQEFHKRFINIHKHSDCIDLLGYDVKTPEGQKQIKDQDLFHKVCSPCVENAVGILQEIFSLN